MKKICMLLVVCATMGSCGVQQFPINTKVAPFDNGGRVFGEMTMGQKFKKKYEIFIVGINVAGPDTEKMAQQLNAGSYTIETKSTFFSGLVYWITFSVIDYRVIKVIKRES